MLAGMLRLDETAVICDLAETYHVLDYRALPLRTVAALAVGLRGDSRIRQKASGTDLPLNSALLAAAVDRLSMLVWAKTKDGQRNRNKPESVLSALTQKDQDRPIGFESAEELMEERRRIMEGG
jgi:hypothetical protein